MIKGLMAAALVLTLGTLGPAHAQPDNGGDNKAQAQELYNDGLRAYNIGEFDQAIKDWKAAYQFLDVPDFLFNIAQAYRQKQEYAEAVFFYNAYLRGKPDATNGAEVTALRDEMAALLSAQRFSEAMPPDPTMVVDPAGENGANTSASTATSGADPAAELGTRLPDATAGKGMRVGGIIAGTTGVAFVATGVVFLLSASSTESDLERAATNLEVWNKKYEDMEASAERSSTIGTALLGVGVVAMVGGGVAYFLGHKRRKESRGLASLRVVPTLELQQGESRTGLAMGWHF